MISIWKSKMPFIDPDSTLNYKKIQNNTFPIIPGVSCIRCWECSSKYDPRCGDPFDSSTIASVDCDQRQAEVGHITVRENETMPTASLCRKTVQVVEGEKR